MHQHVRVRTELNLHFCWRLYAQSQEASSQKVARQLVKKGLRNLTAFDHVRAVDHSMWVANGWGLEVYLPEVRLEPGRPLELKPADAAKRPVLTLRTDQLHAGFAGAWYLTEAVGLRLRCAWDGLHRKWNDCKVAAHQAGFKGRRQKTMGILGQVSC